MSPNAAEEGLLDRLLDRSVLAGYTDIGRLLRQRAWESGDPAAGSLRGRRALVTGAASGLGEESVVGLARLGATVHLLARSTERAAEAVARVESRLAGDAGAGRILAEGCDVSDLEAVRVFAEDFGRRLDAEGEALDVLVHNAGTLPAERSISAQGHELTMATHVLGPVLMTELLLPVLSRAAHGARVVLVASGGMYTQSLPVADPEYVGERYRGAVAYARSKRVQVELAPTLADRWAAAGVGVHVMHPGWADTPGVASSLPLFRLLTGPLLRSAEAGADTIVWLAATRRELGSGRFWHDRAPRPTHYRRGTRSSASQRAEMWRWVREAAGLPAETRGERSAG